MKINPSTNLIFPNGKSDKTTLEMSHLKTSLQQNLISKTIFYLNNFNFFFKRVYEFQKVLQNEPNQPIDRRKGSKQLSLIITPKSSYF